MKQYIRPTADVVELSVKENIAALPNAIANSATVQQVKIGGNDVILTTYNLAATSTSDAVNS